MAANKALTALVELPGVGAPLRYVSCRYSSNASWFHPLCQWNFRRIIMECKERMRSAKYRATYKYVASPRPSDAVSSGPRFLRFPRPRPSSERLAHKHNGDAGNLLCPTKSFIRPFPLHSYLVSIRVETSLHSFAPLYILKLPFHNIRLQFFLSQMVA